MLSLSARFVQAQAWAEVKRIQVVTPFDTLITSRNMLHEPHTIDGDVLRARARHRGAYRLVRFVAAQQPVPPDDACSVVAGTTPLMLIAAHACHAARIEETRRCRVATQLPEREDDVARGQ